MICGAVKIALLVVVAAAGSALALRGVKPSDEPLYAGPTFTCRDGSKTVASSYVNDDYCDCTGDGSDEPGTNACSASLVAAAAMAADGSDVVAGTMVAPRGFWCVNKGFKGHFVAASRVNDGFCDCCDGSDEYAAGAACENTCEAKGREASKDVLAAIAAIEEGAKVRAEWVATAKTTKQTREQQLAEHELALQNLQTELEKAQAARDAAEALETAERERLQAAADAEKKAAEERELAAAIAAQAAQAAPADGKAAEPAQLPPSASYADIAAGIEKAVHASVAAAANKLLTPEQRAAVIEAANSPIPAAGSGAGDAGATAPEAEAATEKFPYPAEYAAPPAAKPAEPEAAAEKFPYPAEYAAPPAGGAASGNADAGAADDLDEFEDDGWNPSAADGEGDDDAGAAKPATPAAPAAPKPADFKSPEAEVAREAVRKLESQKRDLESNVKSTKALLEHDYGADGQYSELQGKCFEWKQRQYTYAMCPYDKAEQKEGGSATSLGKWKGMGVVEGTGANAGKPTLLFTGGARCWQGPERSLTVTLECGASNSLQNVEEPNKCVYTAVLRTPALCDVAVAATLRANLDAMLSGSDPATATATATTAGDAAGATI